MVNGGKMLPRFKFQNSFPLIVGVRMMKSPDLINSPSRMKMFQIKLKSIMGCIFNNMCPYFELLFRNVFDINIGVI
jgi:hypothetical protein